MEYLVENGTYCRFNQGLDFRRLTSRNIELLAKLRYFKEYIFAFDNIRYEPQLEPQMREFKKVVGEPWKIKMFILVGYDSTIREDLYRIRWCLDREILPYVMRHENCYVSENKDFYTDLAAWGNQPNIVKKLSWKDYLEKRHIGKYGKNEERIAKSLKLFVENI